jgi:hypothetical protein
MRRASDATKKKFSLGTAVLFFIGLVIFGALALKAGPAFEWLKTQFLNREAAANQDSLEEQNRRKWCADVFESDSISQADHAYCTDIWKD